MKTGDLVHSLFSKTERGKRWTGDQRSRMVLSAAAAFAFDVLYAFYHGVLGIIDRSLWFLAMCAFYGILAAVRFSAVLCERRNDPASSIDTEYVVMRLSGALLVALSFVLMAVVSISLTRNIAAKHHAVVMITIAAYTFFKMTMTILKAIGQRKNTSPLLGVIRGVGHAETAASLLTLQRSMLVSFGAVHDRKMGWMNLLTGSAVCLFILVSGVGMIVRGVKKGG